MLALSACAPESEDRPSLACDVSLIVLGVAQDGGKPQIGHAEDPAWKEPTLRRLATSLALVDRRGETKRWLFEATPDIREQLFRLDELAVMRTSAALPFDGVFTTHAHIGHYAGLMFFGHESAGAAHLSVYVMPRMAGFLESNGPWSQLIKYENIILAIMVEGEPEKIADGMAVTPFAVPHRQEFSEVVGYRIDGPSASAIFIPDIDRWEAWDEMGVRIEDEIAKVDFAFLDATFYSGDELPGRDMSKIPHPLVSNSLERFATLPAAERAKVRFIHMNHTNPLNDPASDERAVVRIAGFGVAGEGEEFCL
ncbi:MAG: MBL fold metallo-hydrolase [Parvularculaceae bacterium]